MRPSGFGLLALAVVSCGPPSSALRSAQDASVRWSGRVSYDARHPTLTGASQGLELRPARFVDLEVLDGRGEPLSRGRTDAAGEFAIDAPAHGAILRVYARVTVRGHDAAISRDAMGRETHHMDVALRDPAERLLVHASDEDGHAGPFHVVDTLVRGLDAVHEWTGRVLPPVFAYWVRGGTREWSYYRGERPEGSGRYALELLGGDPGQQSVSDTDEHDEAIILHELGHFVMDRLTTSSSSGGSHPRGVRIDPGLAWEEGRATWFALVVLGAPIYRDTIGLEPWGSLRVDENLESGPNPEPGLASETSVSKVLWDLADGTEDGVPDEDRDSVALGPAAVLAAMMELAHVDGAYPCLPMFLRHIIRRSVIPPQHLAAMLQRTGEPVELAAIDSEPWPRVLPLGAIVHDKIDGLTQPAPSGGRNLPTSGYDAIHTYRLHVLEPGMLQVRLAIDGSGAAQDRTDLDLELVDGRADRLADSAGQGPSESLAHVVTAGWYIVRVRDGGNGNRADYRVRADLETLGPPAVQGRP